MKTEYDANIPEIKSWRQRSEEYVLIRDFLRQKHENLKFIYDSVDEAKRRVASLKVTVKRESLPVHIFRRGSDLYVVKK